MSFRAFSLLFGCLFAMFVGHDCLAQTDIASIEIALKGHRMELRNYSADTVARYAWVDGKLVDEPVKYRTLGLFTAQKITLKDGVIVMAGDRQTLIRDEKKKQVGLAGKASMTLMVDLRGADAGDVIPKLQAMLFFADPKDGLAALPPQVSLSLPVDVSHTASSGCGCAWIHDGSQWVRLVGQDPKFKRPLPTRIPDPVFSEEARKDKVAGSVSVLMEVSDTGNVSNLWLAVPTGHGLDEQALLAASGYRFRPATYAGRNVGTEIMVEINFTIF